MPVAGERHARVFGTAHGTKPLESTRLKKSVDTSKILVDIKISGARFQNSALRLCGLHASYALGDFSALLEKSGSLPRKNPEPAWV